ncbi:MAG: hypothetical protein Q7V04_12410 [Deltaproteobacteria bacterium]|nr:hypothetical protein [Deltaproteobacteria bacterium]
MVEQINRPADANQDLAALVAARRKKRTAPEQSAASTAEPAPMEDFVTILMKKGLITSEELASEQRQKIRSVR